MQSTPLHIKRNFLEKNIFLHMNVIIRDESGAIGAGE